MKVGDLVECADWTRYSGQLGTIVEDVTPYVEDLRNNDCDLGEFVVMIGLDFKNFLQHDIRIISESR